LRLRDLVSRHLCCQLISKLAGKLLHVFEPEVQQSGHALAPKAGFENLLDAVVAAKRPEAGTMVARIASTTVHLETPLADVEVGRPVRIAIRAGDILIATERPHGISARNVIPGTIPFLVGAPRTGQQYE